MKVKRNVGDSFGWQNQQGRWNMKRRLPCSAVRSSSFYEAAVLLSLFLSPHQKAHGYPINTFTRVQTSQMTRQYDLSSPFSFQPRPVEPRFMTSISTAHGDFMDLSRQSSSKVKSLLPLIARSKRIMSDCLLHGDLHGGLAALQRVVAMIEQPISYQESERLDNLLNQYLLQTLSSDAPLAYEAVQTYLGAARYLAKPYSLVPKRTLLETLKGLTAQSMSENNNIMQSRLTKTDAAYRILQRLITGNGVRARQPAPLYEADWNRVLGAFCRDGRMDRAHQLVTLHSRQKIHSLSAVTFSILLRAHGQLGQYQHILHVWNHAHNLGIRPDTIMMNTLLNAFIECGKLKEALQLFEELKHARIGGYFVEGPPPANSRTYNTLLKGLAACGKLEEALSLGEEMRLSGLWDFVTTNTLVHAALVVKDYAAAESILESHTILRVDQPRRHPNVDSYTELLDAYCKAKQMDKAMSILKLMRERGVEPTEVTLTCLIAGFGRTNNLDQALKTLDTMYSEGMQPSCFVYNALISAILETNETKVADESADRLVDQTLLVLKSMIQAGVQPDEVTVSTLVSAFGQCTPPRLDAAKMLVSKWERQSGIGLGSKKVATALIKTCAAGKDLAGALKVFKSVKDPELITVNAFLDAACRCGNDHVAIRTFDHYFQKGCMQPDVISFTPLISSLLSRGTSRAALQAYSLYRDMKAKWVISADNALIDIILRSVVRISRSRSLTREEVSFVALVLRDADHLIWEDGQLERRRRVIRGVLGERLRSAWAEQLESTSSSQSDKDELFRRKGWNEVDSGFRLWGTSKNRDSSDAFLRSKGWNDVDSGFRFL